MDQSKFELSDSILNDLSLFNHEKCTISTEAVEKILDSICDDIAKIQILGDSITSLKRLEEHKLIKDVDPQKLARMYSSLSTFLIEATSHKLPLNAAEGILNKCKWSHEQITVVSKVYTEQLTKIRTALKMIGEKPPRIVDLNWRLDYQIESSTQGSINSLLYIITLILDDNGSQSKLTFTATHPELEDLVATLKDACQSVKRFSLS